MQVKSLKLSGNSHTMRMSLAGKQSTWQKKLPSQRACSIGENTKIDSTQSTAGKLCTPVGRVTFRARIL